MGAIYGRELRSFFHTMTGYLFCAFLLVFAGVYTMAYNLNFGYSNFEYVLDGMSFIFMIAVPVLTMRGIAEERRQKTDQLLYAQPVTLAKVVWGKYFAMLTVFAVPVAIIAFYPLILSAFGTISFPTAYGALAGFAMMGAAFIAIGLFISSVTENQAIAAVLCFLTLLVNFFLTSLTEFVSASATTSMVALTVAALLIALLVRAMTKNGFAAIIAFILLEGGVFAVKTLKPGLLTNLLPDAMKWFSLFDRFDAFTNGVFDLTAIVFFIAVALVFVFFTVQSLEKRRWS